MFRIAKRELYGRTRSKDIFVKSLNGYILKMIHLGLFNIFLLFQLAGLKFSSLSGVSQGQQHCDFVLSSSHQPWQGQNSSGNRCKFFLQKRPVTFLSASLGCPDGVCSAGKHRASPRNAKALGRKSKAESARRAPAPSPERGRSAGLAQGCGAFPVQAGETANAGA